MTDREWNEYKAKRCDKLARLARRQGNCAMKALWELYARQYRADAHRASHPSAVHSTNVTI